MQKIGEGGFADVFKIDDKALKKFNYKGPAKHEFDLLKKIDHPNIVKVHGLINNILFAMELMDRNLYEYRENSINIDINLIFSSIVNALKYMKDNNIIHGDLKPHNILVKDDPLIIKVCDFSSAEKYQNNDYYGDECTIWTRSPESLLQYNKCDYQVDIWSFGLILLYMVNKMVFLENTESKQLEKYILYFGPLDWPEARFLKGYKKSFDDIKNIEYLIESDYEHLIKKMLTLNPHKRITIEELS